MTESPDSRAFLRAISGSNFANVDRAVAAIWWSNVFLSGAGLSPKEIDALMQAAGYAAQNVPRLKQQLMRDTRVVSAKGGRFSISARKLASVADTFKGFSDRQPLPQSDTLLDRDMFAFSRGYLTTVVSQLNVAYDTGLYDCCAVMCRRLLETLIIEAYESKGRAEELKDQSGHFPMFSGLLAFLEADSSIHVGRSALQAMKDFKALGDLSAHNRRYNARKSDIDKVTVGLRVASEELLNIAGFKVA